VTELATNLVRHATRGRLWLATRPQRQEVEVLSVDDGPGITDLERALRDGFSTGGTPGTGLGAVRRLAHTFDIHSSCPQGTIVLARFRAARAVDPLDGSPFCVGAVSIAIAGESACGDAWCFAVDGDRAAVLVADGLGHGPGAEEAALAAVSVFTREPFAAPGELLQRMHGRLRSTRGAAITLLQADAARGQVRSAGAGNVMGRLLSGVSDRTLVSQHGTAGVAIRTPEESVIAWPAHAMVVLFSDGIESRWKGDRLVGALGRDPAIAAALLMRDHCRGRDDATVAIVRRNP
jgi:hypothetical protein